MAEGPKGIQSCLLCVSAVRVEVHHYVTPLHVWMYNSVVKCRQAFCPTIFLIRRCTESPQFPRGFRCTPQGAWLTWKVNFRAASDRIFARPFLDAKAYVCDGRYVPRSLVCPALRPSLRPFFRPCFDRQRVCCWKGLFIFICVCPNVLFLYPVETLSVCVRVCVDTFINSDGVSFSALVFFLVFFFFLGESCVVRFLISWSYISRGYFSSLIQVSFSPCASTVFYERDLSVLRLKSLTTVCHDRSHSCVWG